MCGWTLPMWRRSSPPAGSRFAPRRWPRSPAASPPRAALRRLLVGGRAEMARGKGRRSFGSVRQLPSGRWQARYRDATGKSHTAPETFATRPEAARFLAQVEAALARGEWTDPRAGRVSFAEWAARWQATTTNLRPNTRALHDYLLRRFLLPAFADTAVADLDLMVVRSWLAGPDACAG